MGPRQEAQAALFYEVALKDRDFSTTWCVQWIAVSI